MVGDRWLLHGCRTVKRVLSLLAILLALSTPAAAAGFTYVQTKGVATVGGANTTTKTVQLTGVTAGDLIILFSQFQSGASSATASDGTSSLTHTPAGIVNNGSTNGNIECFYLLVSIASGTVTYTVTYNVTSSYASLVVIEYSYTGTATFDKESSNASASTSAVTTGNITTTGSSGTEIVIAAAEAPALAVMTTPLIGGTTPTHNMPDDTAGSGDEVMDAWDLATTLSGQATATAGTGAFAALIESFKTGSGGGGCTVAPSLAMLGIGNCNSQ
jgi:hypothetical protein